MTTTKSLLLAYTDAGVNGGFATPTFQPFSGGMVSASFGQNEGAVAVNAVAAFTLANLSGRVITGVTGTNTFTTRVAGADGAGVVSFPASTTGWFTDSTHSDSVTAGQSYDIKRVNAGFGPTISVVLASAQRTGPFVAWTQADGTARGFNTLTQSDYPFGSIFANNSESAAQAITQAAGTWQALGFITGAAVTATVTFKSRIGGADGNQVASAVNPAIRVFTQDSTHSDSIAAGNTIDIQNGATASSGSYISIYSEFKGTISAHDLGCFSTNATGSGQSLAASTSYFWSLSGALTANTTELNAKANLPYALTLSYLRTKIGTNTTSTCTVKSRKNGADGNSVVSVGSGVTGELSDSTHSDSYAALDDMNTTGVTGSVTSFAVVSVRALLDDGSVTGHATETGTAVLAFSGIAFSGSGRRVESGSGVLAFSGLAFAGVGGRKETGTGKLAFSGISFVASGGRAEAGTGKLAFSGISFVASGRVSHAGSGALHFSGISFVASGRASHTGSGALHFSGIKIIASGSGITTPRTPARKPVTFQQVKRVDPLVWNIPIVDKNGVPSQDFQRKWQMQQRDVNANVVTQDYVDGQASSTLDAAQEYTVTYGASVLVSAQQYSDTHLAPKPVSTVAGLPASPTAGQQAIVTDATVTTFNSVVVGGGSFTVPVFWDSAAWRIG